MEGNVCGVNHLDSDVLLPPRKRLLACLKRQNSDVNGNVNSNQSSNSESPSESNMLEQIDTRISLLLKAHLSSDNPSEEEIVAASRTAAEVATKIAITARAAAQEKAVIAARAMAAAKKALELVASFDDDDGHEIPSFGEQMKKSKAKKQVDVQMLYDNRKPGVENGKANDEELARKLHHAINSSPRISKGGVSSEVKSHKHKKLKTSENGRTSNGSIVGKEKKVENITKSNTGSNGPNMGNGSNVGNRSNVGNGSKMGNGAKMGNGLNIGNGSKVKTGDDDVTTLGRKRGRMKQKKLPLSICNDRDQATPKEDVTSRSALSVGPSASERGLLWKCQSFKAPACVKQNKVMQL